MFDYDENFSFSFMWKDNETSKVIVKGNKVTIEILDENPIKNYVTAMPLDRYHLMKRLETRCFPRERSNADKILKHMGLDSYDVLSIIRITHGAMAHDFIWIKFEGEDLCFKDVSKRMEDVWDKLRRRISNKIWKF